MNSGGLVTIQSDMQLRVPSNFTDYHEKELQIELISFDEEL